MTHQFVFAMLWSNARPPGCIREKPGGPGGPGALGRPGPPEDPDGPVLGGQGGHHQRFRRTPLGSLMIIKGLPTLDSIPKLFGFSLLSLLPLSSGL